MGVFVWRPNIKPRGFKWLYIWEFYTCLTSMGSRGSLFVFALSACLAVEGIDGTLCLGSKSRGFISGGGLQCQRFYKKKLFLVLFALTRANWEMIAQVGGVEKTPPFSSSPHSSFPDIAQPCQK